MKLISILIFIVIISTPIFIGILIFNLHEQQNTSNPMCEEFYYMDNGYGCCQDCHNLNQTYFKYELEGGGFGRPIRNCYCRTKDNMVNQVW